MVNYHDETPFISDRFQKYTWGLFHQRRTRDQDGLKCGISSRRFSFQSAPMDGLLDADPDASLTGLLPDLLVEIAAWLLDDILAEGAAALAQLSACSHTLRNHHAAVFAKLAAERARRNWQTYDLQPGIELQQYAVLACIARAGGATRLMFKDTRCLAWTGRSAARLELLARLMQQHTGLVAHVESHAGTHLPDGIAENLSCQRALRAGVMFATHGVDASRLQMRGWGSGVAKLAQWPSGTESRRVDIFMSFGHDRAPLLPRPSYYAAAPAPRRVVADRLFFDEVAQEILQHPKLLALYTSLHGLDDFTRRQAVTDALASDTELALLYEQLRERAGDSASTCRVTPSFEERRIELCEQLTREVAL